MMNEFQQWCATQIWTASVREMLTKLWNKTESYAVAYDHPGCHRTSNAVDRPMNRLCRLMYAGRGLHGHQGSSELRLRGWALGSLQEIVYRDWGPMMRLHFGSDVDRSRRAAIGRKSRGKMRTPVS